jgi:hypothetical protein
MVQKQDIGTLMYVFMQFDLEGSGKIRVKDAIHIFKHLVCGGQNVCSPPSFVSHSHPFINLSINLFPMHACGCYIPNFLLQQWMLQLFVLWQSHTSPSDLLFFHIFCNQFINLLIYLFELIRFIHSLFIFADNSQHNTWQESSNFFWPIPQTRASRLGYPSVVWIDLLVPDTCHVTKLKH